MDADAIEAWVCCPDPSAYEQRLKYPKTTTTTTTTTRWRSTRRCYRRKARKRFDEDTDSGADSNSSPPAKRQQRTVLAEFDPNVSYTMMQSPTKPRRRLSPRKKSDDSISGPFTPADGNVAVADESDAQATPRLRAASLRRQQQHRRQQPPTFPAPPSFITKAIAGDRQSSTSGSLEWKSQSSSRTRSSSPIKSPDDLLKLEKPVTWVTPDPRTLRDMVRMTGSGEAISLFDSIWTVIQGEGYLPHELKGILKDELMVSDSRFAPQAASPVSVSQKERDELRQLFPSIAGAQDHDKALLHLLALRDELHAIREIVATTIQFINIPRSEATWNDHVHGPILRLATSRVPHVGVENITQAGISKAFIPPARGELESLGGKMIDYAMLLRPEKSLAIRIIDFVDGFDGPRTFNQSVHGTLCYEPTAVLVETKADIRRRSEGKAPLGIWLAAWFGRVASFAPLPLGETEAPAKLPFLPILLVVCENWELHFAFDKGSEFEVCGPLEVGSTVTVDGSYRLLAVARLLAGWVDGEFRQWVEQCVA